MCFAQTLKNSGGVIQYVCVAAGDTSMDRSQTF